MRRLEELVHRDGNACVWCGRELWRSDLTAEHLLPRSRKGLSTPDNLAVACRGCNKRRRTRQVSAFVRAQREVGHDPRIDLLTCALDRLSGSSSPAHAAYARRQLALLERF